MAILCVSTNQIRSSHQGVAPPRRHTSAAGSSSWQLATPQHPPRCVRLLRSCNSESMFAGVDKLGGGVVGSVVSDSKAALITMGESAATARRV